MLNLKLLLCADNAVVDRFSNLSSAINIFEEITPEAIPFVIPRFVVLAIVERETIGVPPQECTLTITIGEQTVLTRNIPIDFQGSLRNRSVFTIFGMPIQNIGILHVALTCGEQPLGHYDILINEPRRTETTTTQS